MKFVAEVLRAIRFQAVANSDQRCINRISLRAIDPLRYRPAL